MNEWSKIERSAWKDLRDDARMKVRAWKYDAESVRDGDPEYAEEMEAEAAAWQKVADYIGKEILGEPR